jgi:hypothetical protein
MSHHLARSAAIACVLSCVSIVLGADFDGDQDVDQADFGRFQECLSGAGQGIPPGCESADLDGDGSVDQSDLTVFYTCMSGPNIPAVIGCIPPPLEDVTLVPPTRMGNVLGTITGYEMDSGCPRSNLATCEVPIFRPYNRDTPQWWDNLVEELIHSRVDVVMMHGRGCFDPLTGDDGNGNMCPRLLRHLVDAINRCDGAQDVLRLGMWDDTGAYQGTRNIVEGLPSDTLFDLADTSTWTYFWDHNMKIWFDTVPPNLWYRLDNRPVIAFWGPVWMSHVQGNASRLFAWLRTNFINRYGEDPHFNVTNDWRSADNTLINPYVQASEGWFDPSRSTQGTFTYTAWNGATWGCAVPAFRDGRNTTTGEEYLPGCGSACREQLRNDGATLRNGLTTILTKGTPSAPARFTLLEGWTDIAENAGYYRSNTWSYPNQYINIVREFSDPETQTLRFQAEAADDYLDTTVGNAGGAYRDGDLDIGALPIGGWYVGWTEPGEWIQFKQVRLACGTYRFTARVRGSIGEQLHLEVDGASLGPAQITIGGPASWQLLRLGTCVLSPARHDLKLVFDTGQTEVDWFFSKKVSQTGLGCNCTQLKSINGYYVTAANGGGITPVSGTGSVIANAASAGPFESFTLIDQNGGTLVSGDKVSLLTWNGQFYLRPSTSGNRPLQATSTQVTAAEQFTIIRIAGAGPITNGDNVALQANTGYYVCAESGGGGTGTINVNRTAIAAWETFRFETCE